jgi:hypothetical protein
MSHPEVDDEITVAESAVPFHAAAGWSVVEDKQADDGKSSDEKSTSERSRARSVKKEQG